MAVPQLLSSQRDFSAGELDTEMKRADDLPIYRAGARQMRNWRTLNSRTLEQRPGRRALYRHDGRIDEVAVTPTLTYDLCFGGDGALAVRTAAGVVVALQPGGTYPWRTATVPNITWTKVNVGAARIDIVITFPGMRPQVASFDGVATWTFFPFAFATDAGGVALVPFFRVAAPGATMKPSATGAAGAAITIEFSADVLNAAHVGTLFRFAGRRISITGYTDARHANATVIDALLRTQLATVAKPDGAIGGTGVEGFSVGQVVRGSTSETEGEVVAVNVGANQVAVQLTNFATGFLVSAVGPPIITELLVGPSGKSKITAVADILPLPAVSWDEQIVSDARGWPQSCNTDDGRLIFTDLVGTPEAALWSVTDQPYNFTIGANPTDAICEVIAGKRRIYHICPWTDEIVFTNEGVFYIPINAANPLAPGSVKFLPVSPDASSSLRPVFTSAGYLYVNAGRNRICAVLASGAAFSSRPYSVDDVSEYHTHLFDGGPVAIALATGDGDVPERYVYVVNADGSVVTGRYEANGLQPGKQWVGWQPWDGSASVTWVSALHSAVRFVSVYPVGGSAVSIAEVLDDSVYLDGAVPINAPPAAISPPPGHGAFWWLPGGTVELLDGVRPLGTHSVDASGYIVPAYQGEDLGGASIIGGLPFAPFFEPFIPGGQPGQDVKQRSLRRGPVRLIVSVKNSTGLVLASLYSGKDGPQLPMPGAVMKVFRVPPWNEGENRAVAPPLREATYRQRFTGRSFDPRVAAYKDVPGPLQLIEVAAEAQV